MISRRSILAGAAAVCVPDVAVSACPDIPALSGKLAVAVSLRRLDRDLLTCANAGRCKPELRGLFGMTRPLGAVLDPTGDVVIVGSHEPGLPGLDIDDLVTALRNGFGFQGAGTIRGHAPEPPGVSIDPDPAVWRQLESVMGQDHGGQGFKSAWTQTCELPMDTRIIGVPHGRTAAVMLEADYLMKEITNGTARLGLAGFSSLFEMRMADRLAGNAAPPGAGNRFWFTPGRFDYAADQDGVLLDHAAVCLRTEAQHFTSSGTLADSGQDDARAQQFAARFSARYQEIAQAPGQSIYKELDDMFRWVALARIIRDEHLFQRAGFAPRYLLDTWPLRKADIPATLPGRARVSTSGRVILSTCGGVAIDFAQGIPRSPAPFRDAGQAAARVTSLRPGRDAIAWALA